MHMWGGTQLEEGGHDVSEMWISEHRWKTECGCKQSGGKLWSIQCRIMGSTPG